MPKFQLLEDIEINGKIIPSGSIVEGYTCCTYGCIAPDEKAILICEWKFLDKFPKYQEFIGIKKSILEKIERKNEDEV